jgi:hypothetical protein
MNKVGRLGLLSQLNQSLEPSLPPRHIGDQSSSYMGVVIGNRLAKVL